MRAARSASAGCCSRRSLVELGEQVELAPAAGRRSMSGGGVQVVDRLALRLERGPLVDARQEPGAPVQRVPLRHAAAERVVHDAERRQALRLGPIK